MSTPKIFSHSKCFTQSQTCPIPVGNSLCGETNSLEIMKEFNKLYEGRMQQVDSIAGGDCLQEKIKLQQEWIQNLTQQNEMLVKAVQDLEYEATERVKQLEDKLHKNAQCLCEGEEMLKTKDRTLQELTQKLNYINSFGDVECMIKELQCRREECKSLKETSRAACSEKETISEKMVLLEKENTNLKQTLVLEKRHIDELDVKFKEFLENRDELKRRIKILEKQLKKVSNEKEAVDCECNQLKAELRAVRKEKETLLSDIEFVGKELHNVKAESAKCQDKIKDILKKNKSAVDQILSLNEENRHLSDNIDALRQRADYATSFTQEEISKLTVTIEELQMNLEKTKIAQDEEEQAHHTQISKLNSTINGLEHDLKVFKQKATSDQDAKTCKICKGKSKVSFLEHTEVQANLIPKESELSKALNESKLKMTQEIERRDGEIEYLKCKVNELELALNSCEERASNLQEAVSFYSNSLNILESAEKQDNLEIQQQRITISNLQRALVESKQELDRIQKKWQDNVSGKSWAAWLGLSSTDVLNHE